MAKGRIADEGINSEESGHLHCQWRQTKKAYNQRAVAMSDMQNGNAI